MSLINQVLRELDQKGITGELPPGVLPAADKPRSSSWHRVILAAFVLLAIAALAWLYWTRYASVSSSIEALHGRKLASSLPPEMAIPEPAPVAASPSPVMPLPEGIPSLTVSQKSTDTPRPNKPAKEFGRSPKVAEPERRGQEKQAREDAPKPVASIDVVRSLRMSSSLSESTPVQAAELLFQEAKRLSESGRMREAASKLDMALTRYARHFEARQMRIAIAIDHGEKERAEQLIGEGRMLFPKEAVWFAKVSAQLAIRQEDFEKALAVLEDGLKEGKPNAEYWSLIGYAAHKLGRTEKSVHAYREAVRLNPEDGSSWLGLATGLERLGHKNAAVMAYEQARQNSLSPEAKDFVTHKLNELGG